MSVQAEIAASLLPGAAGSPAGLCTWNGSDAAQRFAIYRNNVAVSLTAALADNFPVVQCMVGEPFFQAMARLYLAAEPPRSAVLAQYGESFAAFIKHFPPAAGLPYLGDLARLEWLYLQALHAAEAQPLAPAALAALLTDEAALAEVRFDLHPALHIIRSRYAVVSLWAAHQQENPAQQLATVNPALAESALLMRNGLAVDVRRLEEGAAEFIGNLAQGLSFADAVLTDKPFNLGAALELLLRSGAIIHFRTQE